MKEKLKNRLNAHRFEHSMGVADEAVKLARLYGEDEEKAYIAGLLHDCAKGYSTEKQIQLCKELGVELDEITLKCPAVIHAPLGAVLAKTDFGIEDKDILDAIRSHTTGATDMTKLMKIIYIADMIEPMREFLGVDKLRKLAHENLDEAIMAALAQSIEFNLRKNTVIHPDTLKAWNSCIINKI